LKISVLSKRDSFELIEIIKKKWPQHILPRVKTFKAYEIEQGKRILKSEKFTAIQINQDMILPFLGEPNIISQFPQVIVDMGAVKFVCNGAKVMRPGITKFDTFKKGDIVIVKDQIYHKTLATGIAIEDSEIAASSSKGYVVDNLHYISDKFWEAHKEISAS
jgi:malignant T-cell-amplified sequence